jgi:hypothetical protein
MQMADQLYDTTNFLVTDLVAVGIRSLALDEADFVLENYPALLSDPEIEQLAHRLAKPDSDSELISFGGERMMFRDVLQRTYTDNGSGDGRFTPAGVEFSSSLSTQGVQSQLSHPPLPMLGGPMMMLAASRKDLLETDDALIDFATANLSRPMRDTNWPEYQQHVDLMRTSLLRSIRYALVLVVAPSFEHTQWSAERYLGHRDGVLVGLALEAYRRQHGAYPKTLDELTPLLLPQIPADRITGEAVRYRIVDGQPIVYSVGVDRKDDGGRPPKVGARYDIHAAAQWNLSENQHIPDGDWILYPQSKFENDTD